MKQLFIMRGLPGQGKSHIAKILAKGMLNHIILSADDLRITDDKYQFIPEHEPYIWDEFERLFQNAIEEGIPNIIIDNTNLLRIKYESYKRDAIEAGYMVHEIIVGDFNIEKSYERGTHEVPLLTLENMKKVFEFPL